VIFVWEFRESECRNVEVRAQEWGRSRLEGIGIGGFRRDRNPSELRGRCWCTHIVHWYVLIEVRVVVRGFSRILGQVGGSQCFSCGRMVRGGFVRIVFVSYFFSFFVFLYLPALSQLAGGPRGLSRPCWGSRWSLW
jgi:hypothetical protein